MNQKAKTQEFKKHISQLLLKHKQLLRQSFNERKKLAKKLAKALNKEVYDSDEEITKKTGKTPAQIILESGEKAFRDIESEVIKGLSVKSGAVISLGGGAVLRDENVINLKRNGTMVYIKRDLNLLTCKNRPLSKEQGIEKLFEVYEI